LITKYIGLDGIRTLKNDNPYKSNINKRKEQEAYPAKVIHFLFNTFSKKESEVM